MNRFYRVVWNATSQLWVVASEIASSNKKSSRGSAGLVAAMLMMATPAGAEELDLSQFEPGQGDGVNNPYVTTHDNGGQVTVTGDFADFKPGVAAYNYYTYEQLLEMGRVRGDTTDNHERLVTGNKTRNIYVPNDIGGTSVVSVYDSGNIHAGNWNTDADLGTTQNYQAFDPAGDNIYVDSRITTVTNGSVTVDIGDGTSDVSSPSNTFSPSTKSGQQGYTASWFKADGTTGSASEIVWDSTTSVNFRTQEVASTTDEVTRNNAMQVPNYHGEFSVTDSHGLTTQHSVTDATSFAAYNDWVIGQMEAGNIPANAYDDYLNQSYSLSDATLTYAYLPQVAEGDEAATANGGIALIHAEGPDATARISENGKLSSFYLNPNSTLIYGSDGATLINDGVIDGRTSSLANSSLVRVEDATFQNNGTIDVGRGDQFGNVGQVSHGVLARDASHVSNTGTINVYGHDFSQFASSVNYGIRLQTGSTGENSGTINVGTNPNSEYKTYGVVVEGQNSSFINNTDGNITMGQNSLTGKTVGIAVGDAGVTSGAFAENQGTITIAEQGQNSTAIAVEGSHSVVNSGTINIGGMVEGGMQNVGISASRSAGQDASSEVSNSGDINLNGYNAVGLLATTVGGVTGYLTPGATIHNTGNININGGMAADGTRNIGAWADGDGSEVVLDDGGITLSGAGGIGVVATGGGKATVNGTDITFADGDNQIGYYAVGAGSSVDIFQAPDAGKLEVNTDNSVLFRIEDGATINNLANAQLVASGAQSTAVVVSGEGSTANLDNFNIALTGDGATALRVEGGATGTMNGTSGVSMADGAVAYVVDGNKYDVNSGAVIGSGNSTLTNTSAIDLRGADAPQDITLFSVKNGGTLHNNGDIAIADGTAVHMSGSGSTLQSNGSITVEDGVAGIRVSDGATLNTSDQVIVDGSASGILIDADAGEVVINPDAHITGLGSGYGNLITNLASAPTTLVDGATLEMQGSGAALLTSNNLNAASHGQILVSSATGGKGIALSNADGSTTDGSLLLADGWDIDVTGNGAGVYANTTGSLAMTGNVDVTGDGNAIKSDAAGSILISETAKLEGHNDNATLVTGNIDELVNQGKIFSQSLQAKAIALGDEASSLVNMGEGHIVGGIDLGAGNDTALLADNSRHMGILNAGTGDDTVTILGNNASHDVLDGGEGRNTLVFDSKTNAVADESNADSFLNFGQFNLVNGTVMGLKRDLWAGPVLLAASQPNALSIDSSSTLNVVGSQTLSGDLHNNGLVNIGAENSAVGNVLTVDGNLTGTGTFGMQTDLASEQGDLLAVRGTAEGAHKLLIADSGVEPAFAGGELKVVETGGGAGQFGLVGGHVDAGAYRYNLEQRGADWYLASPVVDPVDPIDPVDPVDPVIPIDPVIPVDPVEPTPDDFSDGTNAAIGNQIAMATLWNAEMDTLVKRMGDLRQGKQKGGLWMRSMARSNDIDTGSSRAFDQNITGFELGADNAVSVKNATWLLGGMVGQAKADNNFHEDASGKIDSVTIGGYATYLHDNGVYVDTVVKYNSFDSDTKITNNMGERVKGSMRTDGFGASVEVGKRYDLKEGWYVEPQAQLTSMHIEGDNYTQDDGLQVKTDNVNSLQSRMGVLAGRSFELGNGMPVSAYVKTSYVHEHGDDSQVNVNGHDFDVDLPGSRAEIGVGMSLKVAESSKVYMDMEYAKGDDIETPWAVNVGYRYDW